LERRNNNPFGVKSTASGLGQLLLSNVDKYYPDGRNGIGDALNEAVGMLRYIHDRYGSPEVAGSVYGRIGKYVNARTQVAQVK
jgi:SLT domain-containing protein